MCTLIYQQQPRDITVSWSQEGPVLTTANSCGILLEFSSNSRGIVVWKARDLALGRLFCQLSWAPGKTASSGHNHLAVSAVKEGQLDWGSLNEQLVKLTTKRELTHSPQEQRETHEFKEFVGYHAHVSRCPQMLLEVHFGSCCCLLPNLLNNKNWSK